MWMLDNGVNQYIVSYKDPEFLYQLTTNENNAILEKKLDLSKFGSFWLEINGRGYWKNETILYDAWSDENTICILNWETYKFSSCSASIKIPENQCFLMNNNSYQIHHDNKKLYRLEFNESNEQIIHHELCDLEHEPINIFSVVVLKDTVYYLSVDGLCSIKVSNNDTTICELVESVNNIASLDDSIIFSTDKQNRIWIMNSAIGVIEYDSTTKKANKIAELPGNRTRMDYSKICFYSENYLYYIANQEVYALDTTPTPDPDDPKKSHDQSGHQCGCLGFEFFIVLASLFIFRLYRKS